MQMPFLLPGKWKFMGKARGSLKRQEYKLF
jgi:hypothetical protein